MSDAAESVAPAATAVEHEPDAPAETLESRPMVQAAAPEPMLEDTAQNGLRQDNQIPTNADEDSEAETLIQSPEKRRNIVDGAPRLEASRQESARESDSHISVETPPSDGKIRKRKRDENDAPDNGYLNDQASSHRSSPLSSPLPDARPNESDSGASSWNDGLLKKHGPERSQVAESEEKRTRTSTGGQVKVRKRRPSDIPTQDIHHRSARQKQSLEARSNQDRRETRSATYPRQSSNDRSASPEPISRREHRRVASTQVGSSTVLKKKLRAPAPLITTTSKHNRSSDRHSDSEASASEEPSRSQLHKFTSNDNDAMSPAKGPTGPRKFYSKDGRSLLARACSNNDLEGARARLEERPLDLNFADNAGNTPLHFASLPGYVSIVKFLLEQKCEVDPKNTDGETPMIDAVENGHVQVVKLLLDHGANPRQRNRHGDEPSELVQHEDDSAFKTIGKLIADAKLKDTRRRRSDDQDAQKDGSSRAASAASPRDSPPLLGLRSPPALVPRRRTARSDYTRNDLLWQANTQENLTKLAGNGDVQGVASILNILQKAETDSLIAAAKGGYDEVLGYLLAMGDPDPDPDPIRSDHLKPGYNTPMLAAIGRGNIAVVKLLLEQAGFDPTREYKGRTYPELARERRGAEWQEESRVLQTAYDNRRGVKSRKNGSPRKTRDMEKEGRRQGRVSSSPMPSPRKSLRSPEQSHKDLPGKAPGLKREVKREPSGSSRLSDDHRKKGRDSNSGDHNVAVSSDFDANGGQVKKMHKTRRSQSDLHTVDSENAQKRRRLITGKEHRRRASLVEAESTSDEDNATKKKRAGRLKHALKRSRDSLSPERPPSGESDSIRLNVKKRRTVVDSSPEDSRSTLPKTSNPGTEKFISENSRPASSNYPNSLEEENIRVLSEVDEILKRSQQKKPERPPAYQRRPSIQTIEETQPENTVKISDDERREAEQRARADAEREKALEAERLAKEEERARLQAEKVAIELAARQAEEERLAAERKKAEEAAAKIKAEEDAIARKKEEEERVEKMKREAEERQRRLEERRHREFLEIERRRRDALPSRLRKAAILLDKDDPEVRSHAWLSKFLPLLTVRSSQIIPGMEHLIRGPFEGVHPDDEEWIPNYQVAYLLATKDLNLRSYTSLERRNVTDQERVGLWRTSRIMLSFDFHSNAFNTPIDLAMQLEREERPKFMSMQEIFWVKVSFLQRGEAERLERTLTFFSYPTSRIRSIVTRILEV
jgi:ankyrin repeat protein